MESLISFITDYGLWAVALGAFFQGQTILILAAMMAGHNVFRPMDLFVLATVSAWIGHMFWYALGRYLNQDNLLRRFPGTRNKLNSTDKLIRKNPWTSVIFLQYGYGVRLLGAVAFGVTRLSPVWFALAQVLNCIAWAAILVTLGFTIGHSSTGFSPVTLKYVSFAVTVCLILFWVYRSRNQTRSRVSATLKS